MTTARLPLRSLLPCVGVHLLERLLALKGMHLDLKLEGNVPHWDHDPDQLWGVTP